MRRKMMAAVMAVTMMMAVVACTDRGDVQVLICKAAGSDDITGDYNDYSETDTAEANGSTVTLRGEDGMVKAASWQKDGYTYAIDATEGLPAETVLKLVEETE